MRAILVKLFQVPFVLGLECLLEVIALIKEACAKAGVFLFAHPSDQL
jgi:hypothetical protein